MFVLQARHRARLECVDGDEQHHTQIGEYRVVELLGAGAMGDVFLVDHPRLPRRDALKLLNAGISRNPQFRQRFTREADLLAPLRHPNIITIHDRGKHEGRLWLSMEFVDGLDAEQLLTDRGPLPLPLVIQIVDGVGAALDYAYVEHGITHRDVKPANILVEFNRAGTLKSVKLADFGIAKAAGESTSLTSTGITVGTMSYISPEAIDGEDLTNRADIYSLGCTAFALLTGHPPYRAPTQSALVTKHLFGPVPAVTEANPVLPAGLDVMFDRVLAKKPVDRFATCAEFTAALHAAECGVLPVEEWPAWASTMEADAFTPATGPTPPTEHEPAEQSPTANVHDDTPDRSPAEPPTHQPWPSQRQQLARFLFLTVGGILAPPLGIGVYLFALIHALCLRPATYAAVGASKLRWLRTLAWATAAPVVPVLVQIQFDLDAGWENPGITVAFAISLIALIAVSAAYCAHVYGRVTVLKRNRRSTFSR